VLRFLSVNACAANQLQMAKLFSIRTSPNEHRLRERGEPDAGYLCVPIMHGDARMGLLNMKLKPGMAVPDVFHDFCRNVEETMAEMLVREQARNLLKQSEKKHRTLVEAMPLGIFIHQADKVRFANTVMASMLGIEDIHMLSDRKALSFIAREDRPMVIEHIKRVQQGESLPPVEERLLRRDGSTFWADVRTTPITYEGAPAAQVIVQDISERKQAEEKLSQLSYHDEYRTSEPPSVYRPRRLGHCYRQTERK